MNIPTARILAGLKSLRDDGRVEPLGLSLSVHGWQWFKFKARPGHPKPGNAGRGWTHPFKLECFANSMRPDERGDIPVPGRYRVTDDELMNNFIRPLCQSLGLADWEWHAEFARYSDGTLSEVVILRGGAECWREYPGSALDCPQTPQPDGTLAFDPTADEQFRVRVLRTQEKLATDRFVRRLASGEQPAV